MEEGRPWERSSEKLVQVKLTGASIMSNWPVRDQWESPRKIERHFPIKQSQPIGLTFIILNSFPEFPNVIRTKNRFVYIPTEVDLQRCFRIFLSEETETNLAIWIPTEISAIFGTQHNKSRMFNLVKRPLKLVVCKSNTIQYLAPWSMFFVSISLKEKARAKTRQCTDSNLHVKEITPPRSKIR